MVPRRVDPAEKAMASGADRLPHRVERVFVDGNSLGVPHHGLPSLHPLTEPVPNVGNSHPGRPHFRRKRWRAGHLYRAVPEGYLYARETGSLDQMDPELAAYYAKLRRITSDPVFEPERLRTLISFHLDSEPPER